jgi:hypothetical protein
MGIMLMVLAGQPWLWLELQLATWLSRINSSNRDRTDDMYEEPNYETKVIYLGEP